MFRAFDTFEGNHAAVKEINLASTTEAASEDLRNEFPLLTGLDHPDIVKVHAFELNHQSRCSWCV